MRDPQGQKETDSFINPSDKLRTYVMCETALVARNNEQNGYLSAPGDLV